VPVPDARFDHLQKDWKPKSTISAVVRSAFAWHFARIRSLIFAQLNITDIAGLVKGASEGKGECI
jgi:ribosome-binding ATPase YchF (GTP1/OBG family)